MKRLLLGKIREALISVLPVTLIVILLNLTPLIDFSAREILIFSISALFLILGIGFFTLGADVAGWFGCAQEGKLLAELGTLHGYLLAVVSLGGMTFFFSLILLLQCAVAV